VCSCASAIVKTQDYEPNSEAEVTTTAQHWNILNSVLAKQYAVYIEMGYKYKVPLHTTTWFTSLTTAVVMANLNFLHASGTNEANTSRPCDLVAAEH
jgi:hypothetical protein